MIIRDQVQKEESYNKFFELSNQRAIKQGPLNPEEKERVWQEQSAGSSLSSGTKQMFKP